MLDKCNEQDDCVSMLQYLNYYTLIFILTRNHLLVNSVVRV